LHLVAEVEAASKQMEVLTHITSQLFEVAAVAPVDKIHHQVLQLQV
jgi:hypothetical protein